MDFDLLLLDCDQMRKVLFVEKLVSRLAYRDLYKGKISDSKIYPFPCLMRSLKCALPGALSQACSLRRAL